MRIFYEARRELPAQENAAAPTGRGLRGIMDNPCRLQGVTARQ